MNPNPGRHLFLQTLVMVAGLVCALGASYGLHLLPQYPEWHYLTPLAIVGAALPSYLLLLQLAGWKKGLVLLIFLSLFGLGVETAAVATGWPYGFFRYQDWLGFKILGLVPWTVAFAWPPLVLGSVMVTRLISRKWWDFILSTLILVWFDVVFDPGAVSLGFWHWLKPGVYYGVPFINFAGWIASGLVACFFTTRWLQGGQEQPVITRYAVLSFWLSVVFWTSLVGWQKLWVPLVLGLCLSFWILLRLILPPAAPLTEPKSDKLVLPRPERYYRQRKKG